MSHKPGPRRGWSTDRGIGYCLNRSTAYGKRVGHLFVARICSWCGEPCQ